MALPEHKTAAVYGARWVDRGAVSRALAREGATVFHAGRRRESLEPLTDEIVSAGSSAFFDGLGAL